MSLIFKATLSGSKAEGGVYAINGYGQQMPDSYSAAVSGPYGYGALSGNKWYSLGYPYSQQGNPNEFRFMGNDGIFWAASLGEDSFFMHPDGYIEGTEGCNGIDPNNHIGLRDMMIKHRIDSVYVEY